MTRGPAIRFETGAALLAVLMAASGAAAQEKVEPVATSCLACHGNAAPAGGNAQSGRRAVSEGRVRIRKPVRGVKTIPRKVFELAARRQACLRSANESRIRSERRLTPCFPSRLDTWNFTVRSDMWSRLAISLLERFSIRS